LKEYKKLLPRRRQKAKIGRETAEEPLTGCNGALVDKRWSVSPIGVLLEESMALRQQETHILVEAEPRTRASAAQSSISKRRLQSHVTYNRRALVHARILKLILNVDLEGAILYASCVNKAISKFLKETANRRASDQGTRECATRKHSPAQFSVSMLEVELQEYSRTADTIRGDVTVDDR
jgi:hypothetical protein